MVGDQPFYSTQGPSLRACPILIAGCWLLLVAGGKAPAAPPAVVLNEIHYHPADGSRAGEFVELYNHGSEDVDLGGWMLTGGAQFLFPPGSVIPGRGYLLVAANSQFLIARYGLAPPLVAGEYAGSLSNSRDSLRLWTPGRYLASFIDYTDSDPWPETPDGLGPSLERLSPLREESDSQAWAASIVIGGTPGAPNSVRADDGLLPISQVVSLVPFGAEWRFFRGNRPPPAGWTELDFDDGDWEVGPAGFGYGDGDDATVLEDMEGNYLTVFIRRRFEVNDLSRLAGLTLFVDYDDGFVAYLNGVEVARQNVAATDFDSPATANREAGTPEAFSIAGALALLRPGSNVLSLQGHNAGLTSSDLSLSPALEGVLLPDDDPFPPPLEAPPRDLVINETAADVPGGGWVELYNPTAEPVDASGRRLELHPPSRGRHVLAAGSVVPARGRLVISETALGFEIDAVDALLLATADGRFIDGFNPRSAGRGLSSGRYPDGAGNRFVFETPTPGAPNALRLESRVVINEIMYHPAAGNTGGEYIELFNRSGGPVDIGGWAFTRGVSYLFPRDTLIPPGGYLVIAADPRALEAHYGLSGVLGPFEGRLKNDAETILLRDALGNPADRVRYADEGSWPEAADGLGPSLELVHPGLENRYGPAWAASQGEGTPGALNSRYQPNPPPIIAGVEHSPVTPSPSESVRVLAVISDEREVSFAILFYEIDGRPGTATQVTMVDDGIGDDGVASNGVYGADIPPQPAGSIVAFWIQALAPGNPIVTAPAGAPRPRAFLYQVESPPANEARPRYRLILRAADLQSLRTRGNNSNVLLDTTFVANGRAYYNRGVRYRGSSARNCNPRSYRVQFDHDVDLHGIKRLNLNGCNSFRQWIGLDFLRRTGMPAPAAWFRRVSLNGQLESDWHLRVEVIDRQFLESHLPGDDDGNLYRGINQANLDYRGEDAGRYRPHYGKVTNEREDDYSDVAELCRRFDPGLTPAAVFPAALEERVDTEQWAFYFAAFALLGSTENSILLDNGDDYFLYHSFKYDSWTLLPWDLDSCFDQADQRLFRPSVAAIRRFLEHPLYAPSYWCHLEDLFDNAFEAELVNARIDHLVQLFAPARIQQLRSYAAARRSFVGARLSRELTVTNVSGGVICRGVVYPSSRRLALVGRAPGCGTTAVLAGGAAAAYDPVATSWSAAVDLAPGLERLEVLALDRAGSVLARLELPVAEVVEEAGGGVAVHEQAEGTNHLALMASNYAEVTDPDGDGNVWLLVPGAGGALSPLVLKAPGAGAARSEGQSHAIYRLRFRAPGTYRAYFRARGFDQDSNSFFRGGAFDSAPNINVVTSTNGAFGWLSQGDYTVTPQNVARGDILELRIGVREFRTEVDAIVLSTSLGLGGAALNGLITAGGGRAPRARIEVSPSTEVRLAGGAAAVTLDGSASHDGQCGSGGLSYLWEKMGGPPGDAFAGDVAASSVRVVFAAPGSYRYRLTVRVGAPARVAESAVTIEVTASLENAFTRCDSNGDGLNSITDAIFSLLLFFSGGREAECAAAVDCNADGVANLTDPIFNLNHLFLGGPAPPAPYPGCETAPVEACGKAICAR
jgi:hypothetical protein